MVMTVARSPSPQAVRPNFQPWADLLRMPRPAQETRPPQWGIVKRTDMTPENALDLTRQFDLLLAGPGVAERQPNAQLLRLIGSWGMNVDRDRVLSTRRASLGSGEAVISVVLNEPQGPMALYFLAHRGTRTPDIIRPEVVVSQDFGGVPEQRRAAAYMATGLGLPRN